jgi:hypothetical protein
LPAPAWSSSGSPWKTSFATAGSPQTTTVRSFDSVIVKSGPYRSRQAGMNVSGCSRKRPTVSSRGPRGPGGRAALSKLAAAIR